MTVQMTLATPAETNAVDLFENDDREALLRQIAKLKDEAAQHRIKARENADAAERLREIEEAAKSETQRQADLIRELEARCAVHEANSLRLTVAAKHGIGEETAKLLLTGTDLETLEAQAEALKANLPKPPTPGVAPLNLAVGTIPAPRTEGGTLADAINAQFARAN